MAMTVPKKEVWGAEWREAEITPAIWSALEESGYLTEGFDVAGREQTLGSYADWYRSNIGVDPFETAAAVYGRYGPGSEMFEGLEKTEEQLALAIRGTPLNITAEGEMMGGLPKTEIGMAAYNIAEQQLGTRQEKLAEARGNAMLNWLMGQAQTMDPAVFGRMAPYAMARAQADYGYEAPATDVSGMMSVLQMERAEQMYKEATEFDFFRDLLPSIISLGGMFGGKSGGGLAK